MQKVKLKELTFKDLRSQNKVIFRTDWVTVHCRCLRTCATHDTLEPLDIVT